MLWNYDTHGEIIGSFCQLYNSECKLESESFCEHLINGECPLLQDIEFTDKGYFVELDNNGVYIIVDSERIN